MRPSPSPLPLQPDKPMKEKRGVGRRGLELRTEKDGGERKMGMDGPEVEFSSLPEGSWVLEGSTGEERL